MANKQIAIIGLGPVAASIGLALRNAKQDLIVVGTDRDGAQAARMHKLGAVDRLERRPSSACKDSGLIIVAEPLNDIESIFDAVASAAPAGSVVTDITPLKASVMQWAKERLPSRVSFVGGHPLVPGVADGQPRADLFTGTQYCLVPSAEASEQAVDAISGLVALLGAQPYFLDADEHDGLMAAVEGLPGLMQLALLAALSRAGSWRDNQRATSQPFIDATAVLDGDPALIARLHRLNRQNLARWIDAYQVALSDLKEALTAEDEEVFTRLVADLHETRRQWMRDRRAGAWDNSTPPVEIDKRDFFSRLILPGSLRPGKKPDNS
jgi:prephenate dehydrogenase